MPPVTRSRAAAPAKSTRTTTANTTTTTSRVSSAAQRAKDPLPKPTARLTKKVAFKDASEDEKENEPPVTKSRLRATTTKKPAPKPVLKPTIVKSAIKPTPADALKPTGLRAKPIRKPVPPSTIASTAKTTRRAAKATAVPEQPEPALKAPLLDATRVLSPKKITQVAKATPKKQFDDDESEDELADKPSPAKRPRLMDSEDELNGGKTPIRNLTMSPKRPLSPIKMLSPAKLTSPVRHTVHISPPRLGSLEKTSILLEKSPQRLPSRLQSPQREHPKLLPTLGGLSPKRTPLINFDQSIMDVRSPLKLSPSTTLAVSFDKSVPEQRSPLKVSSPIALPDKLEQDVVDPRSSLKLSSPTALGDNFDHSILDTRSPLKISHRTTLPDPFFDNEKIVDTPKMAMLASSSVQAPVTPYDRAMVDMEDRVEERVTPIFNEFINPSPQERTILEMEDQVEAATTPVLHELIKPSPKERALHSMENHVEEPTTPNFSRLIKKTPQAQSVIDIEDHIDTSMTPTIDGFIKPSSQERAPTDMEDHVEELIIPMLTEFIREPPEGLTVVDIEDNVEMTTAPPIHDYVNTPPQEPALKDMEDHVEEHVTPNLTRHRKSSLPSEKPLAYLDGVVCYLDIRTAEGADANGFFTKLLTTWGAKIAPYLRTPNLNTTPGNGDFQSITHVIWKDGSPKTLEKVQTAYRHNHKIHCVGVNWITDCEKHSARMPEESYTIDIKQRLAEGGSRRRRTMEPGLITPAGHGSVKKSYRAKRATLANSDALRMLANTPLRQPSKYPGILDHPDLPPLPKELETPHISGYSDEIESPLVGQENVGVDLATINVTPRNSLPMAMSPIKPYEHYNPATAYTPAAHTPLHNLLQKTAPAKRTFRGLFTDLDDKYTAQTPVLAQKARRNSDV